MPQHRDPRYRGRGRKRTVPKRKPGHLCTTYTEDNPYLFQQDIEKVRSVWPQEVIEGDRRAVVRHNLKVSAITVSIPMVGVTIVAVSWVWNTGLPWWYVPLAQTAILLYFLLIYFVDFRGNRDENIDIIIRREADRRGIEYDKKTPLYKLMNRINADYNSYLWNREFKWK